MATGRWTEEEHGRFLEGIRIYGTNWREIQKLVPLRSVLQLRTHAQKDFLRVAKESGLAAAQALYGGNYGWSEQKLTGNPNLAKAVGLAPAGTSATTGAAGNGGPKAGRGKGPSRAGAASPASFLEAGGEAPPSASGKTTKSRTGGAGGSRGFAGRRAISSLSGDGGSVGDDPSSGRTSSRASDSYGGIGGLDNDGALPAARASGAIGNGGGSRRRAAASSSGTSAGDFYYYQDNTTDGDFYHYGAGNGNDDSGNGYGRRRRGAAPQVSAFASAAASNRYYRDDEEEDDSGMALAASGAVPRAGHDGDDEDDADGNEDDEGDSSEWARMAKRRRLNSEGDNDELLEGEDEDAADSGLQHPASSSSSSESQAGVAVGPDGAPLPQVGLRRKRASAAGGHRGGHQHHLDEDAYLHDDRPEHDEDGYGPSAGRRRGPGGSYRRVSAPFGPDDDYDGSKAGSHGSAMSSAGAILVGSADDEGDDAGADEEDEDDEPLAPAVGLMAPGAQEDASRAGILSGAGAMPAPASDAGAQLLQAGNPADGVRRGRVQRAESISSTGGIIPATSQGRVGRVDELKAFGAAASEGPASPDAAAAMASFLIDVRSSQGKNAPANNHGRRSRTAVTLAPVSSAGVAAPVARVQRGGTRGAGSGISAASPVLTAASTGHPHQPARERQNSDASVASAASGGAVTAATTLGALAHTGAKSADGAGSRSVGGGTAGSSSLGSMEEDDEDEDDRDDEDDAAAPVLGSSLEDVGNSRRQGLLGPRRVGGKVASFPGSAMETLVDDEDDDNFHGHAANGGGAHKGRFSMGTSRAAAAAAMVSAQASAANAMLKGQVEDYDEDGAGLVSPRQLAASRGDARRRSTMGPASSSSSMSSSLPLPAKTVPGGGTDASPTALLPPPQVSTGIGGVTSASGSSSLDTGTNAGAMLLMQSGHRNPSGNNGSAMPLQQEQQEHQAQQDQLDAVQMRIMQHQLQLGGLLGQPSALQLLPRMPSAVAVASMAGGTGKPIGNGQGLGHSFVSSSAVGTKPQGALHGGGFSLGPLDLAGSMGALPSGQPLMPASVLALASSGTGSIPLPPGGLLSNPASGVPSPDVLPGALPVQGHALSLAMKAGKHPSQTGHSRSASLSLQAADSGDAGAFLGDEEIRAIVNHGVSSSSSGNRKSSGKSGSHGKRAGGLGSSGHSDSGGGHLPGDTQHIALMQAQLQARLAATSATAPAHSHLPSGQPLMPGLMGGAVSPLNADLPHHHHHHHLLLGEASSSPPPPSSSALTLQHLLSGSGPSGGLLGPVGAAPHHHDNHHHHHFRPDSSLMMLGVAGAAGSPPASSAVTGASATSAGLSWSGAGSGNGGLRPDSSIANPLTSSGIAASAQSLAGVTGSGILSHQTPGGGLPSSSSSHMLAGSGLGGQPYSTAGNGAGDGFSDSSTGLGISNGGVSSPGLDLLTQALSLPQPTAAVGMSPLPPNLVQAAISDVAAAQTAAHEASTVGALRPPALALSAPAPASAVADASATAAPPLGTAASSSRSTSIGQNGGFVPASTRPKMVITEPTPTAASAAAAFLQLSTGGGANK